MVAMFLKEMYFRVLYHLDEQLHLLVHLSSPEETSGLGVGHAALEAQVQLQLLIGDGTLNVAQDPEACIDPVFGMACPLSG